MHEEVGSTPRHHPSPAMTARPAGMAPPTAAAAAKQHAHTRASRASCKATHPRTHIWFAIRPAARAGWASLSPWNPQADLASRPTCKDGRILGGLSQ